MSIYSSIDLGRDIKGRDERDHPDTVNLDVSTAVHHHEYLRLALWDDAAGVDVEVLLDPSNAHALSSALLLARSKINKQRHAVACRNLPGQKRCPIV